MSRVLASPVGVVCLVRNVSSLTKIHLSFIYLYGTKKSFPEISTLETLAKSEKISFHWAWSLVTGLHCECAALTDSADARTVSLPAPHRSAAQPDWGRLSPCVSATPLSVDTRHCLEGSAQALLERISYSRQDSKPSTKESRG